ncbi:MAG: hypothetical protein AB1810_07170 [Pseudomonadota bacterium]
MKYGLLVLVSLLVPVSVGVAGSERWIMAITPERLDSQNLLHVRFTDGAGDPVESELLQKMEIKEGSCETGRLFKIVEDYKLGFFPNPKMLGIYLPPGNWIDKTLCFSIPEVGATQVAPAIGPEGRSVVYKLE